MVLYYIIAFEAALGNRPAGIPPLTGQRLAARVSFDIHESALFKNRATAIMEYHNVQIYDKMM